MQGGGRRGPIKGRFHRLAIERDEGALRELRDGPSPRQKAFLKAPGIEPGKDATEGVVRGSAIRQGQEGLEPRALAPAKQLHVLEPFSACQQGAQGDHEDIKQVMLLRPCNAWVLEALKMRDNRGVHGVSHGVCSSPKRSSWEQHSMVWATETVVPLG